MVRRMDDKLRDAAGLPADAGEWGTAGAGAQADMTAFAEGAREASAARDLAHAEVDPMRPTVVVSIFGGPGSGKTTAALDITARLKKLGFLADFAPEYAKEVVWDTKAPLASEQERARAADLMNRGLETQQIFFAQQKARVDRCLGQCDFVVTDSPGLIGMVCLRPPFDAAGRAALFEAMMRDFSSHHNFVMAMRRGEAYEAQGRIESPKRAMAMDRATYELLDSLEVPWRSYGHDELAVAVADMQRRLFEVRAAMGLMADPRDADEASREVLWLSVPARSVLASTERGWLLRLPEDARLCGLELGGAVVRVPLDVRSETAETGVVRLGMVPGSEAELLGREEPCEGGAGGAGFADCLRFDVRLLGRLFEGFGGASPKNVARV